MGLKLIVTVLPIKEAKTGTVLPLERVMDERLSRLASEMQNILEHELREFQDCDDLVIWLSYSSSYAVRWKIVNDVPNRIEDAVANLCAKLGYVIWKGSVLNLKSKL